LGRFGTFGILWDTSLIELGQMFSAIESKKMTTATTAPKVQGKVIASLVKDYQAIVSGNESAIRAFIGKAHKTPARDLEATLKEASKAGAISAIRPAYANYFGLANTCLSLKGSDSVAVADFMKEVAIAQRTLKKEGALALVARVTSWGEFSIATRKAEAEKKANAPEGKGKKSKKAPIEGEVTAFAILSMAVGLWQELEDVTLDTPEAIALGETFAKCISQAVTFSKGELAKSKADHPVSA